MSGRPPRVLIVEDEWIIAADTEDALLHVGCEVLGPAATVEAALRLLDGVDIDAAVLDINLTREQSFPVAELLMSRGTPFVFVSGLSAADLPERFRACPLLGKPAVFESVLAALAFEPATPPGPIPR